MGVRKFSNRHALFKAIHSSIQKKMRVENWEKGSTTHNGRKWFPIQIQIMCTKVGSDLVRKHVTFFALFFWLLAFCRYISNFIVRRCIIKKGFVGLNQILTVWMNGCIYGGNVCGTASSLIDIVLQLCDMIRRYHSIYSISICSILYSSFLLYW